MPSTTFLNEPEPRIASDPRPPGPLLPGQVFELAAAEPARSAALGRLDACCRWIARRPLLALAVALVVWGLTDVRSRGRVDAERPGVHRTDFTVYTEAGAAFFDGRDPYAVTNPRGWGYLYPPLFAMLVAPLHALDPQLQVLVWFFVNLLLGWGCYRESRRILGPIVGASAELALPRWMTLAALATVTLPALNCLQRGQVGIIKTYLLLVGLRLLLESRSWRKAFAAGSVLAAAIALKITPALPVGLLVTEQILSALGERVWRRQTRPAWHARRRLALERACGSGLGTVCGLAACFLLIPTALVGAQRNSQSLDRWWNLVATKAGDAGYDLFAGNSYSLQNQSLLNATRHLGNFLAYEWGTGGDDRERVAVGDAPHVMDAAVVNHVLLGARLAIVALAVWLTWRSARRGDRLTTAAVFSLACVATLIVSPIARTHYFVLALPAMLLVPLWFEREGHARLARWVAFTPALLTLTHYCASRAVGRVGLLGIGITAWFAATAVAMLMAERRRERLAEPPEIWALRVSPPEAAARPALQVDGRVVAGRGLRPLVPQLVHHETDG